MSGKPEDEAVKKFQLQLNEFGKRNAKRFSILGDAQLCMGSCKTPEIHHAIREAGRKAVSELEIETAALNKKLQKTLQEIAKQNAKANKKAASGKSPKPPPIPGKEKETKLKFQMALGEFNSKYLPNSIPLFLLLTAKPSSELPFIDYKKKPVTLDLGIRF